MFGKNVGQHIDRVLGELDVLTEVGHPGFRLRVFDLGPLVDENLITVAEGHGQTQALAADPLHQKGSSGGEESVGVRVRNERIDALGFHHRTGPA